MQGVNQDARRELQSEIQSIKSQISTKRKQIEQVEDMMIDDRTNAERYSRMLNRYEKEVRELEYSAEMMRIGNGKDVKPKLEYAIALINNLVMYVKDAPVEVKIKLIGSIFPEKIVFDGKSYRTKNINRVLDLIYQQTNELRGKKIRKKELQSESSPVGTPNRAFLEPLLADLNMLYELRFWIPNPGEPINPQSFHASY